METGQPFLHVEQLLLALSLSFVELALQELDFCVELLPGLGVVVEVDLQLLLQIGDIAILQLNDLPQPL